MKPVFFCDVDGVIRARNKQTKHSGNAADFNPALHYDMDQEIILPGEKWAFHFSTEMIETLKELMDTGLIEFVWNTNWQRHVQIKLEPLFGFTTPTSFLPFTHSKKVTEDHKGEALIKFLAETPDRPFIWADDVATDIYVNGEHATQLHKLTGDRLIIAPKQDHGISRGEMRAILDFVHKHN